MSPSARAQAHRVREASSPIDFSSPASTSSTGRLFPYGSSPNSGGYGSYGSSPKLGSASAASAAKAYYAKLRYSDLYDRDEIEVGFLRDTVGDRRRSGAEAWSERVQSVVVDISFEEFAREVDSNKGRASEGQGLGGDRGAHRKHTHFHRVKYFKRRLGGEDEGEEILWEAPPPGRERLAASGSPSVSYSSSPPLSLLHGLASLRAASECAGAHHSEDVLPDQAWLLILQELEAKELCVACSVSKHLSGLVHSAPFLWTRLYERTFGAQPEEEWSARVVKHVLCKSERSARKWLDSAPSRKYVGFQSTSVLSMDDSHVVSGDGQNLRVWVHKTDRRIKTLKGHTAAISCIGFDHQHISSGDVTGHLKLWSMDELKNMRSMRAHADTVSDCLHFQSLCLTCSLDGFIKVWDIGQAHPLVLTLEGGERLYNLCAHGARNRLYSVGARILGWDLETAREVCRIEEDGDMVADPNVYYGYDVDVWPGTGMCSKALANNGHLLASAGKGIVNLYDLRTARRCCAFEVAGGAGSFDGRGARGDVAGLDLDDWKLSVGFKGGQEITVHDVRAASSGRVAVDPSLTLRPAGAPGKRVSCFSVFDSYAVAGLEGEQCFLWNFDRTHIAEGGSEDEENRHAQTKGKKKKKNRCPKERKRFPKRTTR